MDLIETKLVAIFNNSKYDKTDKSIASRLKIALMDTDKIGATQLDSDMVKNDINLMTVLLKATTEVYKHPYLYMIVYPLSNFSVNDQNKALLGTTIELFLRGAQGAHCALVSYISRCKTILIPHKFELVLKFVTR